MTSPDTTPAITGEDEWGIKGVAADVVDMARDKQFELVPTLALNRDAAIGNAVIAISGLLDRSAATLRQQLQAVRAENAEMREVLLKVIFEDKFGLSDYSSDPQKNTSLMVYFALGGRMKDGVLLDHDAFEKRAANLASLPAPEDGG